MKDKNKDLAPESTDKGSEKTAGGSIFREKSLKRISSPEELDNYLVVTKPTVWIVLAAVIVFLIGVIVWGVMGRLETSLNIAVVSGEGQVLCYVPAETLEQAKEQGRVNIGGTDYAIKDIGLSEKLVTSEMSIDIRIAGQLAEGTFVVPLAVEASLPDGIYKGQIVVESVRPISFILN